MGGERECLNPVKETSLFTRPQEGEEKCKVTGPLIEEWRWPSLGAPNGVVDVCGTVTSISLCQGARPPELPLPLPAADKDADMDLEGDAQDAKHARRHFCTALSSEL